MQIVRAEVNSLVLPFFSLSRKDASSRTKTEYQAVMRRGNQRLEVYWKVAGHPEYGGHPGPFDRQVYKAIEQIISEQRPPLENPIPLGSLYRIARIMGLSLSGHSYQLIHQSIRRIINTAVESRGAFYNKGRRQWITDQFHLYERFVARGDELPDGEIADTNYLYLGSWLLENINARYVKPLDYEYYRSLLSHVSSRLYELLGVKFYGMGRLPYLRYRYSTLCQLLPVTRYKYRSRAVEKLQPAHQELLHSGFLAYVEWSDIPGEAQDWYVAYTPGPRATEEARRFSGQLPLLMDGLAGESLLLEECLTDPDPALEAPLEAPRTPVEPSQAPQTSPSPRKARKTPENGSAGLVGLLEGQGVSPRVAQELAAQAAPQTIRGWIKLVQEDSTIQDAAAYLVKALREGWQLPEYFQERSTGREEGQEEQPQKVCAMCQGRGFYWIGDQGVARCTHTGRRRGRVRKADRIDASAVWGRVLERLRGQMPGSAFETWLKGTRLLGLDGSCALLGVPTQQSADWLERRLYRGILQGVREATGRENLEVEMVVSEAALAGNSI